MSRAWRPLVIAVALLCLVGAGGQQGGDGGAATVQEPPIVDPSTGLANLCLYPSYVVIGQWTHTSAEEVPRLGLFTRGSLLVERVLLDDSAEMRAGQTVEILMPGGVLNGMTAVSNGAPYPRVGEWWFVAITLWPWGAERVATRRLPGEWIPHIPDELTLRSAAQRLCDAHAEGIYKPDLTNRELQREAVKLVRPDLIRLRPQR